nr:hypothetical protein [Tanacetum cinerariifolium]
MLDLEDSTIIYMEVSSPFDDLSDVGSSGVVVYGYDGLLMHPPSPDYVPGPKHLPSPDYMPATAYCCLTTVDSLGYITESDPEEDLNEDDEDPKEDPANYATNRDDDDDKEDESFEDDADDEEED